MQHSEANVTETQPPPPPISIHPTTPPHTHTHLFWRHSEVDDPEVLLQPVPHKNTPRVKQVVQLEVCCLEGHKVVCAAAGV
jgi:hypothetical protein